MSISNLYKGSKMIESLANYGLFQFEGSYGEVDQDTSQTYIDTEVGFWRRLLAEKDAYRFRRLQFGLFVLTRWVPRVPGLYFTEAAARMRSLAGRGMLNKGVFVHSPQNKSRLVIGGIGTLKLAPDNNGWQIFSLCMSGDSNKGIPALISPEVIEHYKLDEGAMVGLRNVRWQENFGSWSSFFSSTEKVPKGAVMVDHPDQLYVVDGPQASVLAYPYTIMEYPSGQGVVYDFVYCTTYGREQGQDRANSEEFFRFYAQEYGHGGQYLINPDTSDPLFDARYQTPAQFLQPAEKANRNLIYQRIKELNFSRVSLNHLIDILPGYFQNIRDMEMLCDDTGVNHAIFQKETAVGMSAQLIDYCVANNMVEQLIDAAAELEPKIFSRYAQAE